MLLEIRLKHSPEIQDKLDAAKLDTMDYDNKWGRYRIRVDKNDISKNKELLKELMMLSYGIVAGEQQQTQKPCPQFDNPKTGLMQKRDSDTGQIMDVKTTGGKFKGVRNEK